MFNWTVICENVLSGHSTPKWGILFILHNQCLEFNTQKKREEIKNALDHLKWTDSRERLKERKEQTV